MTERINSHYRPLFEVRLLHHYWLDEGATIFDLIADPVKKNKRLMTYDRRFFLTVTPTVTTAKNLKSLGCVYKDTATGFTVAIPSHRSIPEDTPFDFIVTVTNNAFFNYTALTLPAHEIHELYHEARHQTYRFKTNVFVLSNLSGVSRGTGVDKTLFLSTQYVVGDISSNKVEALFLSGNALMQLTSDGDAPNPTSLQLNIDATKSPVFVHQGDVPERSLLLTNDIPDNVFALIRLFPIRPDDKDFSLIDSQGFAKEHYPIFDVRFKNRSTVWRYVNKNTHTIPELNPLPLTYFGPADSKLKPSEGWVKVEKNGTKVTRLISDIFV